MTKLLFSEMEASADYYVAVWDELRLEHDLFEMYKISPKLFKGSEIAVAKWAALREIDRLKAAGTYEAERENLRKHRVPIFRGKKLFLGRKNNGLQNCSTHLACHAI